MQKHRPAGTGGEALRPLVPIFLTYVLSFVNIGIYWNKAGLYVVVALMWLVPDRRARVVGPTER